MDWLLFFALIGWGVGLALFGYGRWKGKMHGSYFAYGFFREANYTAIPFGLSLILISCATLPVLSTTGQMIFFSVGLFVMILGLIVSWRLFKPDWVRWVEENHNDILPYLALEIRDHGWHVTTQEELKEWIENLRVKYQYHLSPTKADEIMR